VRSGRPFVAVCRRDGPVLAAGQLQQGVDIEDEEIKKVETFCNSWPIFLCKLLNYK
jgi:hypothetical protein